MTPSVLSEFDRYLLAEGTYRARLRKTWRTPRTESNGQRAVQFAVWAPNAEKVSVIGDFNGWNTSANPMQLEVVRRVGDFVPDIGQGALSTSITSSPEYQRLPGRQSRSYGFAAEIRPQTGVARLGSGQLFLARPVWMAERAEDNALDAPDLDL